MPTKLLASSFGLILLMGLLGGCISSPSSGSPTGNDEDRDAGSARIGNDSSRNEDGASADLSRNESFIQTMVISGRTTGVGVEAENPVEDVNYCFAGGCDNRTLFNLSDDVLGLVAELDWDASSALEEDYEFDVFWYNETERRWTEVATQGTAPLRLVVEEMSLRPDGPVRAVARPQLVGEDETRAYASQGQEITFYISTFHNTPVDAEYTAMS